MHLGDLALFYEVYFFGGGLSGVFQSCFLEAKFWYQVSEIRINVNLFCIWPF